MLLLWRQRRSPVVVERPARGLRRGGSEAVMRFRDDTRHVVVVGRPGSLAACFGGQGRGRTRRGSRHRDGVQGQGAGTGHDLLDFGLKISIIHFFFGFTLTLYILHAYSCCCREYKVIDCKWTQETYLERHLWWSLRICC